MAIYIILFLSILVVSRFVKHTIGYSIIKQEKGESIILTFGIIALYLLCSLKATTVGGDTVGYEESYIVASKLPWDNFKAFNHFETGYVLLTKIFAKAGFSFQFFTGVVYLIIYIPLYAFLKKHSKDVTLSLIIYICYQFFVFNLSGIRQAIAMGICLTASTIAFKNGFKSFLLFCCLVILASKMHTSALIFILFYFVIRIQIKPTTMMIYIVLCAVALLFRNHLNSIINEFFGRDYGVASISLGGSFIFLVGITMLGFISNKGEYMSSINPGFWQINVTYENAYMPIMLMSILCYIVLSGSTMLRATMYYNMYMMIILPNYIKRYNYKEQWLIRLGIILLMFLIFYTETLLPNQFFLIPYKFFWE